MKHFILTRFNLRLWRKDKHGLNTQTEEWLNERCKLFERYTLPSVVGQSCQDFKWIILFDEESPEWLKNKIENWRDCCQQILPVWVKPVESKQFLNIFRKAIARHIKHDERIITSYLDNDDALHRDYVAKLQMVANDVAPNTILSFTPGMQYYEKLGIGMCMDYRNNHFISLVEDVVIGQMFRTVFGFGGHYHILKEKRTTVRILHTRDEMMWIEVIHAGNVDNDVKMTLKQHLLTQLPDMKEQYSLLVSVSAWPRCVWCFQWLPQAACQFARRCWHKLFGHNWHLND